MIIQVTKYLINLDNLECVFLYYNDVSLSNAVVAQFVTRQRIVWADNEATEARKIFLSVLDVDK